MNARSLKFVALLVFGAVTGAAGHFVGASFWEVFWATFVVAFVIGPFIERWARVVTTPEPRPTHDDL